MEASEFRTCFAGRRNTLAGIAFIPADAARHRRRLLPFGNWFASSHTFLIIRFKFSSRVSRPWRLDKQIGPTAVPIRQSASRARRAAAPITVVRALPTCRESTPKAWPLLGRGESDGCNVSAMYSP